MKYRILGKKLIVRKKVKITGYKVWTCLKCNIIYGKGETILEDCDGHYCPIHKEHSLYWSELDYWQKRCELEKILPKSLKE